MRLFSLPILLFLLLLPSTYTGAFAHIPFFPLRDAPLEAQNNPIFSTYNGLSFATVCSLCLWQENSLKAGGFVWETSQFLFAPQIFSYAEHRDLNNIQQKNAQLFTVGLGEFLWKSGRIGIGFDGVRFGYDLNLGLSKYHRWQAHGLLNLLRTKFVRLDYRLDYLGESMSINATAVPEQHFFAQGLRVQWQYKRLSGQAFAMFGVPLTDSTDPTIDISATLRLRMFSAGPVQAHLRIEGGFLRKTWPTPAFKIPNTGSLLFGIEVNLPDLIPNAILPVSKKKYL